MLIFPINTETFQKSFLSGDGEIELQSDQDIWLTLIANGGKFLPNISRIAEVKFKFANEGKFRFGSEGAMRLSIGASAGHEIRLIWPDEDDETLKALGLNEFLTEEKLYVRLLFEANGDLAADAKFPVGTLSATFGIGAGGRAVYERFKSYDAEMSAKDILSDLLTGMRLPQQVDSVSDIPEPGEALITQFGGYLKLKAGMNWGYEMTGSRSIEINQLNLDLDYALRMMAAVSTGYSLAGDFRIEARRGAEDGWARYVVRKSRDSQFNFTADFGLDGKIELKGLPESADEFLIRLIGADAKTVLDHFQKAREYASLDKLEEKLTPMIKSFVHEWSFDLIDKALSNDTLQDFLNVARRVTETYNNLEPRIVDLYHTYLDKIPHLRRALALLAGVNSPVELAELTETDDDEEKAAAMDAWDVAQLLWGTSVYPLLLQNEKFLEFSQLARKAQAFVEDGATEPVRNFIAKLKSATRLDPLFEKLGEIKTADQLKQVSDEKLQELAGRLIGEAFDELKESKLNDAVKTLQQSLNRIEDFKNNWYARVTEAVSNKFTFDLHYAYSRSSHNRNLLDVELNLNRAEGRELARAAATGDFSGVLENYNSKYVRINDGVFTHTLEKSAQLQINVMGWGGERIRKLTQIVEHEIEPASGGLLHLYAIDTSSSQLLKKGRKFKETVESNFLLRAVGETFQPEGDSSNAVDPRTRQYLVQTLKNLAAQYDLLESDDHTSAEELKRYLDLAEFLGLFDKLSREDFVSSLATQFPDGFGNVKISYIVRYDDVSLRNALGSLSGDELRELARQTMRRLIGTKYTGMKQTDWLARVGFAYLSPSLHEVFDKEGFTALRQFKSVTLPAWFTKGAPMKVPLSSSDIEFLITLCNIEKSYADRMVKLDNLLDRALKEKKPIPLDDLKDAARKFVEMADDLDDWRENAFFAIFDKIVEAALKKVPQSKSARESAMVLEITADGKNRVTKVLMRQN
ncbi:MAG TPA: hypothetical protein VJ810_02280 [Blastocatellia bacterium]|nr:hypothetical protein [Blastocatellia bacterium]